MADTSTEFQYLNLMIEQQHTDTAAGNVLPDLTISKEQVNELMPKLTSDPRRAVEWFALYIFGSKKGYEQAKSQYSQLPQPLCAKSIPPDTLSYKCYDCGNNNDYHIFCEECFLNGEHTGHRYLRSLERAGCCDCGDINAVDAKGFCRAHRGFVGLDNIAKELNSEVRERLEYVVVGMFDRVFTLCEQLNIQGKLFTTEQLPEYAQPAGLDEEIAGVLLVISFFVDSYCKDMLPVLFEFCNILSRVRTTNRMHICGSDNYRDTFMANQEKQAPHECETTIVDLIYMHSMLLRGDKETLTNILYTLFMNPTFKLFLVEKYAERYKFLVTDIKDGIFFESELKTLYTQFFSRDQIRTYLNSPFNRRPLDVFHHYYSNMLNSDSYRNNLNGVHNCVCIFEFMQGRIQALGLQLEGFNMLNDLLRLTFLSVPNGSDDTQHQKYRLIADNMMLNLICKLLGSFKYEDSEAQKLLGGLIILYFSESEKYEQQNKQQTFMWFTQPERVLGLVLLVYVLRYGVEDARKLVDQCLTPKTYEKVMMKLLRLYDWEEKLMQSNYVGFLGEETPKDLLKYYYRIPTTLLHDSNQLCLQMLAIVVNPELFTKFYLENLLPDHQADHLLQFLTEESFAVNSAAQSYPVESPMIEGVKKLFLINAMNVQKKQTFESIGKLFDRTILSKKVKIELLLPTVTEFDRDTGIYTVKPEYEGFIDRQGFFRNSEVYSKLNEKIGEINAVEFRKDTLLRYQVQNNIRSVCWLVTENLCNSVVFMSNFLCRYFRQLWAETDPAECAKNQKINTKKLRIIDACLIRCSDNDSLKEFLLNQYEHNKQASSNQIHQILLELIERFSIAQKHEIKEEKSTEVAGKSNKAALRKRQLLEEMKQKSEKFISKNNAMMSPEKTPEEQNQKVASECLICHERNGEDLVLPFRRIIQQTLPDESYQSFGSCFHTFHFNCLAQFDGNICPLCKTPFNLIIFELYRDYPFFSLREGKDKESFFEGGPNMRRSQQILRLLNIINEHLQEAEEGYGVSVQFLQELIVSKIQQCIAVSGFYFGDKVLPLLKSLMIAYSVVAVQDADAYKEAKTKALQQILSRPCSEFIHQVTSAKLVSFVRMIEVMLGICVMKGSNETISLYRQLVRKYFNAFLAASLISSGARQGLQNTTIEEVLRINKDTTYSQMTEFCRGVLEVYSLIFEESFQKELQEMDRDITAVVSIIDRHSNIFEVDFKLLEQFLKTYNETVGKSLFSQESLLIRVQLIDLPDTYAEFHRKYYDTKCSTCHDYPRVKEVVGYMCLLCGYGLLLYRNRACETNCTGDGSETPQISTHNKTNHCRIGAHINIDSGEVYITEQTLAMSYGSLYLNQFDVWNNEQEKDWSKLLLDRGRVTRITGLLHKHTVLEEINMKFDNNHKFRLRRV